MPRKTSELCVNVESLRMSKEKRLGLDLDGVLFDFNRQFINLAIREFGAEIPDAGPAFPTRWNYMDDFLEPKQVSHLWNIICRKDGFFWANLPTYEWSRELLSLAFESQKLYYITSRVGPRVQQQSEEALRQLAKQFGRSLTGAVIAVEKPEDKIPLINALKLTHFVDDKTETVDLAHHTCPATWVALWHQPWNLNSKHANRIATPDQFGQWLGVI